MSNPPLFPDSPSDARTRPEGEERALSVSELTARIKDVLSTHFPSVWVAGEICDLAQPRSGHYYLTLKDDQAQIAAVMWRNTAARVRFDLHDGLAVLCRASVEVYPPRGKYQLVIQQIEPQGIGALELALRQLRERLARDGVFDPARKRPLPRFMRRIVVITSPTGAAIRDFLEVLRRRWGGTEIIIVPARVQGDGAAAELAAAVRMVNQLAVPVDCLVLTRGGGSLEDLWAFNEEILVRAIRASRIPVVSGVGHEIDVTLSDLAADLRALTPSDAAARVAPSLEEMTTLLQQHRQRLTAALRNRLTGVRGRLQSLAIRRVFRSPMAMIHDRARRLDELESRGNRAIRNRLRRAGQQIEGTAGRLTALSPLAVLARGFSLTQRLADARVVRDAAELSVGEQILTRFAAGHVVSRVEQRVEEASRDAS